jgi:hypothetical protein
MKIFIFSCLALLCTFSLNAFTQVTDNATGEAFPTEVSFDYQGKNYQLDVTGVSTRKKLFIKVYSVAHYLQKGAAAGKDKLQEIMNDANAKQLSIKWVRSVPAATVHEGYEESLKVAFPDQSNSQLQSAINSYIGYFNQDVEKGDEHIIRWIPGGVIEVQIKGKTVGTITNPEFAKGLWNIWFGPKSVVNRDNLMSMMK